MGQVGTKLRNFGTNLEPSWSLLGQVGACWGHVGTRLGQVGAKLGEVGLLGSNWGQLAPTWLQLGTKLGPSWSQVGAKLGQVGAKLGLCWQILQEVGSHNARLRHMSPKIIKDGSKEPNMALKSWILERFWASCWHSKSIKK